MIENLIKTYHVFKEVKDYRNILSPANPIIKVAGLDWMSRRFVIIAKNLKAIENFIAGDLTELELTNIINEKESESGYHYDKLSCHFKTSGMTKEEIDWLLGKFEASSKATREILKLMKNNDLTDYHLSKIRYMIIKRTFEDHRVREKQREEELNNKK